MLLTAAASLPPPPPRDGAPRRRTGGVVLVVCTGDLRPARRLGSARRRVRGVETRGRGRPPAPAPHLPAARLSPPPTSRWRSSGPVTFSAEFYVGPPSLYLQDVLGYSALQSGAAFAFLVDSSPSELHRVHRRGLDRPSPRTWSRLASIGRAPRPADGRVAPLMGYPISTWLRRRRDRRARRRARGRSVLLLVLALGSCRPRVGRRLGWLVTRPIRRPPCRC